MDSTLARAFAKEHGGRVVHRAWRDTMLKQGRPVAPERLRWDTLAPADRELDEAIAYEVVARFILWCEGREEERIGAEERGR
jgi:hypothetical protein